MTINTADRSTETDAHLLHENVPVGPDESANVVVRTWGEPQQLGFQPRPHWELGEELGIVDFERGVKLAGSRFYVLRELGARLQRALITWMIDLHVFNQGYTEVYPPFVVREECMWTTGQMPKFGDNLYRDLEDVVRGVKDSKVVSWFIRSKREKGEKARLEEEAAAAEEVVVGG